MKKFILGILSILLLLTGCQKEESEVTESVKGERLLENCPVKEDAKYDSVYIDIPTEEFLELGFELGDSVNVIFSNGYTLEDIPVYDGYYSKYGEPLINADLGNESPKVARSYAGVWSDSGLKEGDTVSVELVEKGKYLDILNVFRMTYSNNREDFETDEEFANYRMVSTGKIKEGRLYRGCSVLDNEAGRAEYVSQLIERDGIGFILDLSDDEEDISTLLEEDEFDTHYAKAIYESGHMAALGLSVKYRSDSFKESLGTGLKKMGKCDGPYYIHCKEGKDRTGFVMILLETLCDSSYEEMLNDYMLSYKNFYGIDKDDEHYSLIVEYNFVSFLSYLSGNEDVETLKETDFAPYARNYLHECGMNDEEIDWVVDSLIE